MTMSIAITREDSGCITVQQLGQGHGSVTHTSPDHALDFLAVLLAVLPHPQSWDEPPNPEPPNRDE